MRILFVNPVATLGGAERSLLDVLRALRSADPALELRLLLLEPGPLQARARALGAEVEVVPLPASLRELGEGNSSLRALLERSQQASGTARQTLAFLWAFRQSVARARPDLLHTNGMKAHLLAGVLARDIPCVLHIRDFLSGKRFSRRVLAFLQRRTSMLVANSQAVARDTRIHLPRSVVRTVYNAIDLDHFSPGPADRARLAQLAGLPPPTPDCVCFGMVATYARWKGQALFLEAAARLVSAEPGRCLRFYVVGGPIYTTGGSQFTRDELLAVCRKHGLTAEVGLVPFQEQVLPVYRALDVFVQASTAPEPFGRSIIEAMATGRPVIAARNGGAVELFSEGVTALGFETGRADELAAQMSVLASSEDLRSKLALAARAHVHERFGLPRLGADLRDVYGQLLARAD